MVDFEEYHWKAFFAVMSTVIFVVVCAMFDECDSIKSLTAFCLVYALIGIAKGIIGYVYKMPFDLTEEMKATWYGKLDMVLGIGQVALAIWGAALTFPQGGSNEECSAFLYYNAFISSLIPICLIFFMLIMYGIEKIKGSADDTDSDDGDKGGRNERSASLVDSEIGPSAVADVDEEEGKKSNKVSTSS